MPRQLLLLVVLLAGGAVAYWGGGSLVRALRSGATTNPVVVSELLVEVETTADPIREADQFSREVSLTNGSSLPITLNGFENSCSCLSVQPSGPAVLVPSETKPYMITLKGLIPDRAKVEDDGVFRESVTLTPVYSVGESAKLHRTTAEIRYAIRAAIRLTPTVLNLGVVSDRLADGSRTVTCQLLDGTANVAVEPHAEWSASIELDTPRTRVIRLVPRNPGTVRSVSDVVRVVPLDESGAKLPARSLPIVGEVKADIQSEPVSVPFGRVAVGDTVEDVFRLVSLTQRPFTIAGVTSASGDVAVVPQPTDATSYLVRLTAKHLGEQELAVAVRVKQDDGREVTAAVPVRYRGEPRTDGGK